eukprot:1685866-Prymnesium_polylepis.2
MVGARRWAERGLSRALHAWPWASPAWVGGALKQIPSRATAPCCVGFARSTAEHVPFTFTWLEISCVMGIGSVHDSLWPLGFVLLGAPPRPYAVAARCECGDRCARQPARRGCGRRFGCRHSLRVGGVVRCGAALGVSTPCCNSRSKEAPLRE